MFYEKENIKSVKQLEVTTYQSKTFENPNIVDIKSITTENPKTSHKLFKTMRQVIRLMALYVVIQKSQKFLNKKKKMKITKRENAFKGFASTYYNVEILNSFNPEVQLNDSEAATKSKLIKSLTHLKGFKFVTTLVLVLKKIENEDKTKYDNFCFSLKAGTVINDSDIDDVFPSIYITVITKIQKSLGKGSGWIIDSVIDHTISISKYNLLAGSNYKKSLRFKPSKRRID